MNKKQPGSRGRWRKMKEHEITQAEALLRSHELFCVTACSRFLKPQSQDRVWTLQNRKGGIVALIVYSRRNLLPVFCGQRDIPPPAFCRQKDIFLPALYNQRDILMSAFYNQRSISQSNLLYQLSRTLPVHSIQGLRDEVIILERHLENFERQPGEKIDYDLMSIDKCPDNSGFSAGPAGLVLRAPRYADMNTLAALQAGYEQEEVLPAGAVFNPAASRLTTKRIFSEEQVLTAELEGRLIGKINTSGVSFSRFQVGGVYVCPEFRGMGIASRMTAEFVRSLIAQGKGVSLFVKKSNAAALSIYRRLGFEYLADYRISYYL